MNCNDPRCAQALELLYAYLDKETPLDERQLIAEHLTECEPCRGEFGVEESLINRIAEVCGCGPSPEGLISRIQVQIDEIRVNFPHHD